MLKKSEHVISESKKLEMITSEINTGMDEMTAGARQINNSVQDVNSITIKNRENIEALLTEVSKFQI
jgi:methyl-accepting chemotaxis protein